MPSKELIEKVASNFEFPDKETTLITAENILTEILAALQDPTEAMREVGMEAIDDNWERGIMRPSANSPITCWRAMLAASALGEQSE